MTVENEKVMIMEAGQALGGDGCGTGLNARWSWVRFLAGTQKEKVTKLTDELETLWQGVEIGLSCRFHCHV